MKRIALCLGIGSLLGITLAVAFSAVRAGDIPEAPSPTPPVANGALLKGSGLLRSLQTLETGETVLTIADDEMGTQRDYIVPEGLTARRGEAESPVADLQQGELLDIDYFLSQTGERRITHLSVIIALDEHKLQVDAPVLESLPQEKAHESQ